MLKSFIGADMRLYERFGIGLHNNPDAQKYPVRKPVFMRVCGVEQTFDHFLTTKKPVSVGFNRE